MSEMPKDARTFVAGHAGLVGSAIVRRLRSGRYDNLLLVRRTREPDIDTAWQQVLASLQSTSSAPVPPWPVSEDLDSPAGDTRLVRPASLDDEEEEAGDDEHFVPPAPPPLPRLHRKTLAALASIALGLLILATNLDGGTFTVLAVIAIIAGLATLVWRMHDGPPTDSGWDDGAVV